MEDAERAAFGNAVQGRAYPPPARSEAPWPAYLSMLAAIALQLLLPSRLTAGPNWLVPALEVALLGVLAYATPRKLQGPHSRRRAGALLLTGLVSAANIFSLVLLSRELLKHGSPNARALISSGALIWLTNVIIFGLWYWETDRGGPGLRAGREGPRARLPLPADERRPYRAALAGARSFSTTSTCRSPTRWPSARPTRCR